MAAADNTPVRFIAWRMRRQQAAAGDAIPEDEKPRYCEIPDKLCEQNRLGRKTGAGYYVYEPGARRGNPDPLFSDTTVAQV